MKWIITIALCLFAFSLKAQDQLQFNQVNHTVNTNVRYKLYPTFNVWTFIKLDTRKGDLTQVHFSIDEEEAEVYLGAPPKIIDEKDAVNGQFELYPTSNSWTFLLLDQIDGDVYHIQWHQNRDNRAVIKIKYAAFK
ncbi:MAG: hypothetical protein PUC50_04275 [Bacteroidales bacterium]|nr:hypothetical protein [Bacteroidales bacterium]